MNTLAQINDLQPIAKRLREREEQITSKKKSMLANIGELIAFASDQGQDIILAKTKLGKALKWGDWLTAHVPNMDELQAAKYERVATEQLNDPRQCVFAFLPPSDNSSSTALEVQRIKPAAWEIAAGCIYKFMRIPIEGWPHEQLENTRGELKSAVERLGGKVEWK